MNPFASPEEASPYEFPEFPKPEEEVTEYANVEGAVDYRLKGFGSAEAFYQEADMAPVVQPVIFQDFKQIIPAPQA